MKKTKFLFAILILILIFPLSSCADDSIASVTAITLDEEECTLEASGTQLPVIVYHYGRYRMRTAPYEDFWYFCDSKDAILYVQDGKVYAASESKPEYSATLKIVSKYNSNITAELQVIKQKIDLKSFTLRTYGGKTGILPERSAAVQLQTDFRPTNATTKTVTYQITKMPSVAREGIAYATMSGSRVVINSKLTDVELRAGIGQKIVVTARVTDTTLKSEITLTVAERTEIYFPYQLNNIREKPAEDYILMDDLDMSAFREWTPIPQFYGTLIGGVKTKEENDTKGDTTGSDEIKANQEASADTFNGRFTISNLKLHIAASAETGYFGLFGINYGTIQNIDFDGTEISAVSLQSRNKYVYAGVVCGLLSGGLIQNSEIQNAKIEVERAYSYIGGIAGTMQSSGRVLNCEVSGAEIDTYGYVGGVTSTLSGRIENTNVKNTQIRLQILNQNGVQNRDMGGIAGTANGTILNCTVSDVNLIYANNNFMNLADLAPNIGIIAGRANNAAVLTNVDMENTEINIGGLGTAILYEGVLGSKKVEYIQYRYCHSQNALKTLGWYVYGRAVGKPKITVAI